MTKDKLIAGLFDVPVVQKYVLQAFRLKWFCFEHMVVTLELPIANIYHYIAIGNTTTDANYCLTRGCRNILYLPAETLDSYNCPDVELNNLNAVSREL